jgi:ferredoxin
MAEAHPENVAGPFYVEDGCCISCGVPVDAAPDIFDWASSDISCVVKRQPVTQAELDRTMIAISRAEVDCIRYRGDDPVVSSRIALAGHGRNCDILPADAHPMLRFRVRFASRRPGDSPRALAASLREWLPRQPWPYWRVKPPRPWSPATAVFAWNPGWRPHFNSVRFEAGPDGFRALLHHGSKGAGVGLGLLIHEWLTEEIADEVSWLAADEDWSDSGFHMPV